MNQRSRGITALAASTALVMLSQAVHADETKGVGIYSVNEKGAQELIGKVTIKEHQYGVLLIPDIENLEPGLHGFHLHENPDCSPARKDGKRMAAASAGGHFDPEGTGKHRGPFDTEGHLGDLPALFVNQQGEANQPELAPRLTFDDFDSHALVIHQNGDNYSDDPKPLGGGGSRVACGAIQIE